MVGVSGSCTNGPDKVVFSVRPSGGLKGAEKLEKIEVFLTYEWVVGS